MNTEVKPGYKQTEVGVIPEDWEILEIGKLASFKSGNGISVSALQQQSSDSPIPVYGGNGIAGYTTTPLLLEPVVVVGRVGQKCGQVYLTKGPAWITDNALYPRVIYREIDVRFFSLALQTAALNDVRNRNDLPLVTLSILHSVSIAFPPAKAEQEAIAEALSDADALIVSLEQFIQKKRLIKQGAMQELLRPKDGWVAMKLGRLGLFLKGSGVRREDAVSGDIPCVRYGEIYTRHNDFIKVFDSWISPEVALTAKPMKTGDMLFAGSGETKEDIGKCVAFLDDFEAYAGGDIIILRPENVNSRFLGYYLNSESINRQKASKGQGDAVVHITANALADVDLMMPSVDEQFAIASVLSDMDAELSSLEEKLMKVRHLKNGMMRNLLTGKIRLVIGSKF